MNEMKGETRDPNNDDDSEMKRGGLRKALYKLYGGKIRSRIDLSVAVCVIDCI